VKVYCCLFLLVFALGSMATPLKIGFSTSIETVDTPPQDAVSRVLIFALDQIPATKIKYEFVGLSRAREWQLVKAKQDLCLYNKVKNSEREQHLIFSRFPISVFPPNRLIVAANSGLPRQVSLRQVINSSQLKIGIANGRSYGNLLDQEIDSMRTAMFVLNGTDVDRRLIEMLATKKLDGIIDFSAAFFSRLSSLGGNATQKFSVHRLNSAQESLFGYVGCSNTSSGRAAIGLLDAAFKLPEVYAFMLALYSEQFPPEETPLVIQELESRFKEE